MDNTGTDENAGADTPSPAFSNLQVAIGDLPQAAGLDATPLEPAYVKLSMAYAVLRWLIVFIAATIVVGESDLTFDGFFVLLAVPVLIALATLDLLFSRRAAMVKRYALREHDIVFESGVFWRSQTIQPLNRVQHVEVGQGPVDKRFSLARLQLFSSGSGASSLTIPGLPLERAEDLREFILAHRDSR